MRYLGIVAFGPAVPFFLPIHPPAPNEILSFVEGVWQFFIDIKKIGYIYDHSCEKCLFHSFQISMRQCWLGFIDDPLSFWISVVDIYTKPGIKTA
jgi:hypothetical protein